jgi:hypothetical protein
MFVFVNGGIFRLNVTWLFSILYRGTRLCTLMIIARPTICLSDGDLAVLEPMISRICGITEDFLPASKPTATLLLGRPSCLRSRRRHLTSM